jgi:hypothetical protein
LFTFVISLVVVGTALFLASRIAIGAAPKPDKPATPAAERVVARHVGPVTETVWGPTTEVERVPVSRRIRSAFVLIVMLTVLGVVAALVIVIGGAVLLSALRSAVQ